MNIKYILKKWLIENHYDGLYNSDFLCDCHIINFMPCDNPEINCKPGYRCENAICKKICLKPNSSCESSTCKKKD